MSPMRRTVPDEAPSPTIEALDAFDVTERRDAIRRLPNTPEINKALVNRLDVEPEASVRELILTTLVERQSEETVRLLIPFLGSDDAALRTAVAGVLQVMPELVAGQVPALLASDDHDVRIMTLMVLGKLKHPKVPGWLVSVVEADPHPNVVGCALNELLQLADTVGESPFEVAAARFPEDPFIAFLASLVEAQRP